MLKTCPDPVDVNDIQFKLHCSLKVFNNTNLETFQNNYNLVSCASRYGLLFVGSNTTQLKAIHVKNVENYTPKDKDITNFSRRNISLPSPPTHICVNCDSTILAIVIQRDNCPVAIFYDVLSFYKQNVTIIREVRLSATPGTFVTEINWNPALPEIFTACKSDGSLGVYEVKENTIDINELPAGTGSTSFCWSPKGKQIAVGSKDGKITQYKPNLKAVKVINAPTLEGPHSVISLCWVSNYQFIGIYQSSGEDGQANLIVVDSPKTGATSYTNYDDVCYSGSSRKPQFYLNLLQHWNMLMIASSNSMELGLLGVIAETWTQWNVPDFARAELSLGSDKQETLPIGMSLDISNTKPLPWGEGTIPPCPYLLLLSHQGVLYFYHIVNLKEGMPNICCPPDNIADTSGMAQFITEETIEVKSTPIQVQQPFSFGTATQPIAPSSTPTVTPLPPSSTPMVTPFPPQSVPQTTQPSFSFAKPPTAQPIPSFVTPQVSVPAGTSLFGKPIESKAPLFDNQVTITPVKPQPQPSGVSIFGGSTTLTPIKPQQPVSDSSEKYASIFSALKAPSIIQPPAESKPILIATKPEAPKISIPEISKGVLPETPKVVRPETPKTIMPETLKNVLDPKLAIDEKVKGEKEALLAKMVKDDCISLESELKAILHQGRKIDVNIGSDAEKIMMLQELENSLEFIKDIVDVSLGDSAEVHALKQNLILSWAWYEEALSRYNVSKDETMSLILKNQPLDSATEKRQADIRTIIYYLDSQLSQANRALDEQWDKFQDYTKKTYKIKMPTMEAIFQTMVSQNATLQKQSYVLMDINSRLERKKSSSNGPSLFVGLNTNTIEEDLRRLQLNPDDGNRIIYEQTVERTKKLSSSKANKIRDLLKTRDVSHVTATKPLLNSSISRSPANRSKDLFSILGAKMSPVARPTVVKNLQFSESTPVKVIQDIRPTKVPPNTPAQPDITKTFTFKSLDKNVVPPPTSTFLPLSKDTSLSNLTQTQSSSAFVLTTKGTKTLVLPSAAIAPESPSVQPVQFSFDSTSVSKPAEKLEPVSVATSTKPVFNFGGSSANLKANAETVTISTSSSGFPSFSSPTQNLFSFGKPSFSFSNASVAITSTESSLKNAASIKPQAPVTTSVVPGLVAVSVSKPSTAGFAVTTAPAITKPILFGSAPSTTASKIISPIAVTTAISSSALSTISTPSVAITTQTTSLFGSISSASVTTSLFGAKPVASVDSTVTADSTTPVSETSNILTTTASIFGSVSSSTASKSIFASASTTSSSGSIFGSSISPVSSTSSKLTFGFATPSTGGSIFGGSNTSPEVTSLSIFSSSGTKTSTSIFGDATSSNIVTTTVTSATTQASIFSSSVSQSDPKSSTSSLFSTTATTTQASIFIGAVSTTPQTSVISTITTTQPASIFINAAPVTQSSIFGSTAVSTQSSLFSTPSTTQTSIFGSPTVGTSSIFGAATAQPSLFTTPTTTQTSIFGGTPAANQPSVFGTPTTTQSSIFGTPKSTSSSIFGTPTTTQTPLFGTPTTAPSVFGTSTTTQSSVFGTTTTESSVFGTNSTTTATSVFGTTTTSTPASIFGSSASTTQSSIFGAQPSASGSIFSNTPASSTQGSIFGSASPTSSSNSIFGTANTTSSGFGQTTTSIFGSTAFGTNPTTTSAFGQPATFGSSSGSIFGTPTTSTSIFGSSGNTFGAASTSSNVFGSGSNSSFSFASAANNAAGSVGFGDLSVGTTPTTTGSIFGGSTAFGQTPPNPFGRPASFETPSSTTGSIFGNSTSGAFGSNTQQSTFGSTSFGSSGGFGQQSSFGQSNFGQQSTFGSAQSGPFSGGGTAVGQSGFGSPTFQKPGGFGAAPVFGGSPQPAFGGSPSFGGAPAFGGAPTFGSPSKVFGASTPAGTFGTAAGGSPGFGNIATQNTLGFGNLAQQNATPTSTPFSGNSSFSNWR